MLSYVKYTKVLFISFLFLADRTVRASSRRTERGQPIIECGYRVRSVAPRAPRALATLIPVAALPFLREGAHLFPKPLEMVLGRLFHVLSGVNGNKSSSVKHHAAGQVPFCDSFSAFCFRLKDHASSVS